MRVAGGKGAHYPNPFSTGQGVKQEREERQRQGAQQQQQQDQQPKQAQKQRDAEYIFGRMMVFDDDPLFPLRPPFNSAPPFSFAFLADCPAWQDEDHEDLSAVEGISSASSSSGGGEKGSCAGSATTEREREIEPGRSYDITEFFKLDEFGETLSGGEVEERAQKPEWQSVSP